MEVFKTEAFRCIQFADAHGLGNLISLSRNPNLKNISLQVDLSKVRSTFSRLPDAWIDIFEAFFQCIPSYLAGEWSEVFQRYKQLFNAFLRIFQSGDASMLSLLYGLCDELWLFSQKSTSSSSNVEEEEAARLLNKTFTACLTDRSSSLHTSRRMGVHLMFCKLLRAYFHLGQFRLAKNAILALKVCDLPELQQIPKTNAVAFQFFLAVYHFHEAEWSKAEELLDWAFENSIRQPMKNMQLILHFLIPLKVMLKEQFPSEELLAKYALSERYSSLLKAVERGNLAEFQRLLQLNSQYFITLGTYLCIESLEFIVCKRLLQVIFEMNGKNCKLPLEMLLGCWKISTGGGNATNLLQLECVLANLIGKALVKGYIAHERQFLVLSQNDPFPLVN